MATIDPVAELKKRLRDTTQTQLAIDIGVSRFTLWQVVHGKIPPGEKILTFLGIREKIVYQRDPQLIETGS